MITQAPLGGSRGAQCQLCCFLVVVQGDCLCWMLELGSLSWSCLLSLLSPLMSPQFLWPAVTALVSVSWRIHNNHKTLTSTSRHRESFKRYTSNYTMSQNPDLFTQLPGMKKNYLNSSICWFVKNLLCVKKWWRSISQFYHSFWDSVIIIYWDNKNDKNSDAWVMTFNFFTKTTFHTTSLFRGIWEKKG